MDIKQLNDTLSRGNAELVQEATVDAVEDAVSVYLVHMEALFELGRFTQIIALHERMLSAKSGWFVTPVGEAVAELTLIYTRSLVKSEAAAKAVTVGRAFIESVVSKPVVESIQSHNGSVLLDGALTESTRSSVSRIAALVADNVGLEGVSPPNVRMNYYLISVFVDQTNLHAWDALLSGPLLSESAKIAVLDSVKWADSAVSESVREIVENWIIIDDFAINHIVKTTIREVPNITRLRQSLRSALALDKSDTSLAIANAVKANPLAINDIAVSPLVAVVLFTANDKASLFKLSNYLLAHHAESPDSFFVAGIYYLSIARFDFARKFFSKATAPSSPHGWIGYGLAFSFSDESGHAINAFRSAARSFPKCVLPWLYIGMEYIRTNELKLAQSYLVSALELCSADEPINSALYKGLILNEIGVICLKAEQFDISAENLSICCSVESPHRAIFYANLGQALLKLRDISAAVKAFESAVTLNRRNGNAVAGLAYCHHCRGNLDKAIDLYNTALGLISGNRKTENLLNSLIQIAVNEYSFSVKLNLPSLDGAEGEDMIVSAL